MERELTIPKFLKETADDIHKRMLEKVPRGINTTEGDFFWDCTRPTAEEKAKLIQLQMQNILKLAFPQFSYGEYLKYLGECNSVFENLATKSIGILKIEGKNGTVIEKGKIVSTTGEKSIEFEFTETKVINSTEIVYVNAKCISAGSLGNVLPGTINVLVTPINGVRTITNEEPFKGGTDVEDEEHFRERVITAEQEETLSGADTDYIRWAKEIDGVGSAYCIEEWNGPGTVKLLILDKNNQTATDELLKKVKDYIYPDKKEGENRKGKAPVGAKVTVTTPTVLNINIKAKFNFTEGFDSSSVLEGLKEKIQSYLKKIKISGIVNYNAIHSIVGTYILLSEGIDDFESLKINDDIKNIKLVDQVAIIGEIENEV